MEPILVYLALAVFIGIDAIREDGFKFIVYDRDRDGTVQEGTKWERKFFYINRDPLKKYRKNS
jgi:hypothetical protein